MEKEIPDELWAETTWEGNRRAQLRRALEFSLRERLQAVEDMADVARRFEEMRERGEFAPASPSAREPRPEPPSGAHAPSPPYDSSD